MTTLSKICFRAGEEAGTAFLEDETGVLKELHDRLTTLSTKEICRQRTREEVEAMVAFWWKLQTYRSTWLERKGRHDTVEEILSDAEIQAVKRVWEYNEMWWDLSEDQRKTRHLPSIYNAALHGKTGWATAANAIIKYRMPQLPMLRAEDGVTEHINIVGTFCRDLADWMNKNCCHDGGVLEDK